MLAKIPEGRLQMFLLREKSMDFIGVVLNGDRIFALRKTSASLIVRVSISVCDKPANTASKAVDVNGLKLRSKYVKR
jgi:hypothetical protein